MTLLACGAGTSRPRRNEDTAVEDWGKPCLT
jgi:hypothetical protein